MPCFYMSICAQTLCMIFFMRIGFGFDVHAFQVGRPLVLGGVTVPYDKGLAGHSDADVLVHAVMDALLGALALGDIGQHFPPGDPAYKNISSMELLARVKALVEGAGAEIGNIDSVIVAEKPKMAGFIPQMRENIAKTLGIDVGRVSVKATTTEGLGYTGRGEGIAAQAVVLVEN